MTRNAFQQNTWLVCSCTSGDLDKLDSDYQNEFRYHKCSIVWQPSWVRSSKVIPLLSRKLITATLVASFSLRLRPLSTGGFLKNLHRKYQLYDCTLCSGATNDIFSEESPLSLLRIISVYVCGRFQAKNDYFDSFASQILSQSSQCMDESLKPSLNPTGHMWDTRLTCSYSADLG